MNVCTYEIQWEVLYNKIFRYMQNYTYTCDMYYDINLYTKHDIFTFVVKANKEKKKTSLSS